MCVWARIGCPLSCPRETELPNSKLEEKRQSNKVKEHLLVVRVEEEYGPDWSLLWLFAADVEREFGFVLNLEGAVG